jgi:hypothetical protein
MRAPVIRTAAIALGLVSSIGVLHAADQPRKVFADTWRGRRVEVRRTLFTLVYNERGKLGKVHHDQREGLVVITPSSGSHLQFDGRDGETDIASGDPQQIVDRIGDLYRRQEPLEIGFYLRIEPVVVVRYEARGALVVRDVQVDRNRVRLSFGSIAPDAPRDEIATALTVQWPTDFSAAFTERPLVEDAIRQYVDERGGAARTESGFGIRD